MKEKKEIENKDILINVEELIKLFLETQIYTFLKIKYPSQEYVYNGYIRKNEKDKIIFLDDKLGEIPILKFQILKIMPSKGRLPKNERFD